jgi:O-succinylbenzoic acid--CoA ligase
VRLDPASTTLELSTTRLSPGRLRAGVLEALPRTKDGWWRSGDMARLCSEGVEILGRTDGAISSGGETVFPAQLEGRLMELAHRRGMPLASVLLLGRRDPPWGERLVALVRPVEGQDTHQLIAELRDLTAGWPAHERPRWWWPCPELAPNSIGKWERGRWWRWLDERWGPG